MHELLIERGAPAHGAAWRAVVAPAWRRLVRALQRLREDRRRRADLRLLDAQTLRDLGIDRSELGSCAAEAEGRVERTRRRVAGGG